MSANSGSFARKRSRSLWIAGSGELMPAHLPLELALERACEDGVGRTLTNRGIVRGGRRPAQRAGHEPAAVVRERAEHVALPRAEERGRERGRGVVEVRV